jgi:hypothetical protein
MDIKMAVIKDPKSTPVEKLEAEAQLREVLNPDSKLRHAINLTVLAVSKGSVSKKKITELKSHAEKVMGTTITQTTDTDNRGPAQTNVTDDKQDRSRRDFSCRLCGETIVYNSDHHLKGWEACPALVKAEKEILINHTVKTGKAGKVYAEYRSAVDPSHQFQFLLNKSVVQAARELFEKMKTEKDRADQTFKVSKTEVGNSYEVNAVNTSTFQILEERSDIDVPDGGAASFNVCTRKVEELEADQ